MSEHADVLESLLEHPGWKLFRDHVAAEWSPAACWKKALTVAAGDVSKAEAIERVNYINGQVGLLIEWPKQEIARDRREDKKAEAAMRYPRGGYP